MKTIKNSLGAALLLVAVGCGGSVSTGPVAKDASGKTLTDGSGNAVSAEAANKFKAGLSAMAQHDKANSWSEAACNSTAEAFLGAAKEQSKPFAEAIYNAGLAYQRCGKTAEAKKYFQQTLDADSKFHPARTQLALYAFADSGEKDFDKAIADMRQAVLDAQFQNPEALVNLAMLQMRRGNSQSDSDGANDMDRAKKNMQRALAIDDGFMPAFNQLALYYLQSAKQKAGRDTGKRVATAGGKSLKKIDTQALELAALVCSQAVRKNANYAPIHNTAGMIQFELKNLNGAVASFNTARKLDPSFYEAQMNFADVNVQFRGFKQAEEAYRAALKMRPSDYDARLGLALALRGQIDDSNFDKMVAAASAELESAKKLAPNRPEAYYNDAILTQGYKAKSGGKGADAALLAAKGLFGQFIQKAGGATEFADAVKRSKEQMEEIDQIMEFNKQTEAQRKASEAELRTREAEAEAAGEPTE